ncbi:MAG TPA: haloacid dehalogenase type II [Blastocatellia bacterium]|nr:haloacid dehalogenase type II [Blastocatellia bacterium]
MMTGNQFDLITFDCYGTLIDWEGGITRAFQEETARDKIQFNRDEIIASYMAEEPAVESERYRHYRDVLTETAARVAARLGWNISKDRARFLPESLPRWEPFADTNAALERLARRYRLGILSNTDDDLLAATRRHFTVDFDLIVTAEQVKSYKPCHAHFKEAIRRAGGKRILHAAQSYFHDIVPASELGLPVVWVNRKGEGADADGRKPTHEVKGLAELVELLGA